MVKRRTSKPAFTSPPVREVFNNLVWDIVARIPKSRVITYGAIGSMIDRPKGIRARYYHAAKARWVGSAMAACPSGLPWHRVINAQGKVSIRTGNDHHLKQRTLLEAEGVRFDEQGKVDLDRYLWKANSRQKHGRTPT